MQIERYIDICGVVGTGKTTTIIQVMDKLCICYLLLNCFSNNKSEQTFIQQLEVSIRQIRKQRIFIIDECDQIQNLQKMIEILKQKDPICKIILISNNSCQIKFKGKHRISRLYFMPQIFAISSYTQYQLTNIAKHKLAQLYQEVPRHVLTESVKKASIVGGDFREVQKKITSWCRSGDSTKKSLQGDQADKQQNCSIINNIFVDPTEQFIKILVSRNNTYQNTLLLEAIKAEQREEEELSKRKRSKKAMFKKCRCERNTLRKLVKQMSLVLSKNQCEIFLKQYEEMGLIKLSQGICSFHKIETVNVSIKVRKQTLKNAITKQFYSLP